MFVSETRPLEQVGQIVFSLSETNASTPVIFHQSHSTEAFGSGFLGQDIQMHLRIILSFSLFSKDEYMDSHMSNNAVTVLFPFLKPC
jgi:hypothetical protein